MVMDAFKNLKGSFHGPRHTSVNHDGDVNSSFFLHTFGNNGTVVNE